MNKILHAFKAAFPFTLPICAAFLFLGSAYGFYVVSKGFPPIVPILISIFVFAGSMQFVMVPMMVSPFDPFAAFYMTLLVNSRHFFYGLTMLDRYKNMGLKKLYMIFALCDETFAVNVGTNIPEDVDKGWFYTFVSLLNQSYWVIGTTFGAFLGSQISINTKGLDFVLVCLFLVIFVGQWQGTDNHKPALTGLGLSLLSLLAFGPKYFIPPAMVMMIAVFVWSYYKGGGNKCQ
ncbi:MAG: AzlC family ABC transporter permease [Phascolarctobacterium sp.]|nr:AzlC family ABC transporter permease [Phascolarctobacterium sp.]